MMPSPRSASWARVAALRQALGFATGGDLLSLLLPGRCAACPAPALGGVCDACLADCSLPRGPTCRRCGAPWTRAAHRAGWCGRCWRFGRPFAFDAAVSLWHYRKAVRHVVHAFKFRGRQDILRPLGVRMARSALATPVVAGGRELLVIPVPARRASRRRRGYDQARGLASGVAAALGAPWDPGALGRRHQPSRPQAGTPGEQRRRQLRAGFRARRARVLGRRVLLVDDVMSTGGTVDAAARALRVAGAEEVRVIVLAS